MSTLNRSIFVSVFLPLNEDRLLNAEDDIPDFHARSRMGTRVERQADYIGKGTQTSDQE